MTEKANDSARTKASRDKKAVKNLKPPKHKNRVKICRVFFEVETSKSEQEAINFYKKRYPEFEIIFNHIPDIKKKV